EAGCARLGRAIPPASRTVASTPRACPPPLSPLIRPALSAVRGTRCPLNPWTPAFGEAARRTREDGPPRPVVASADGPRRVGGVLRCGRQSRAGLRAHVCRGWGRYESFGECEAGFEGAAHRAGLGDLLEALDLSIGEMVGEVDRDLDPSGRYVGVVVDVNAQVAEIRISGFGVEDEHRRDAGCECGGEELVWGWGGVGAAEAGGFVGDDRVASVDGDLVSKGAVNRLGRGGVAHGGCPCLMRVR